MNQRLPPVAILLGIAGLLPFIACTIGAIDRDPLRGDRALLALLAYGAVILAFLGGIQWGFVLSPAVAPEMTRLTEQPRGTPASRLVIGVLPSLIGWLALLMPMLAPPVFGLAVLIAGFLATAGAETHAARQGLIAHAYLWMRWPLTVIVVALLTTTLTLRLLGVLIKF